MSSTETLTPRQARFIEEFLVDANGTQAAIRAGTAPAGAHVWASRALRDPKVAADLKRRQATISARLSIERENVLNGLLEAVDMAREQRNPMAMISAWKQVSLLMGYNAPHQVKVEVAPEGKARMDHLERLSDAELLAMIEVRQVA